MTAVLNGLIIMRPTHGDVKVSTGVWKRDKRAVDCISYEKICTLNTNAKNNNNFAFAA